MKRVLMWIVFCLVSAPVVQAAGAGEIAEGSVLRDVTMRGLTGEPRALSAFRGKPLIINMWASYCSPCLSEMASLERLAKAHGKQFNVIGISIDDYVERAQGFLGKVKTTFPHYIDHQLTIENMLGASRIPLTVLVDAQGRVLYKVYGAKEWDSPEALRAIGQAFGISM